LQAFATSVKLLYDLAVSARQIDSLTGFSIFGTEKSPEKKSKEMFSIFPETNLLNGLIWQNKKKIDFFSTD
jgi:hypothetical protein